MPKRSRIKSEIPEELRLKLEDKLIDNGFSDYSGLEAWLSEQGFSIGRSSIQRHGKEVEERIRMIKVATEAATQIDKAAKDDEDSRSGAVIGLIQTDIFNIMLKLKAAEGEEDSAERMKLLADVAKAMAQLSRASINQKQHASKVRQQERAKAAEEVSKELKRNGISEEVEESIRRVLLGHS